MDIIKLIGNTPVAVIPYRGRTLVCKLEKANPSGSIKDRAAAGMILAAERDGLLREGGCIIEPTSGNTGIALAMIGAAKGYKVVMAMPESMSQERRSMITAYGAQLLLTPAAEGMSGAIAAAERYAAQNGAFMPMQFENPANTASHTATASELAQQAGSIDATVACVGSGGTFSGISAELKRRFPKCLCVAVEPAESAVLSGGKAGPHKIQGIGAGFIPKNMNVSLMDRVIAVEGDDAIETARSLARREGLFVGISSGAAFSAMLRIADELPEGSRIAGIFPDGGDRYLSVF